MIQAINDILYRIAEEVLEKIAFIFSFPESGRDPIAFEDAVVASVSFSGVFDGSLLMAVSHQVLPELTGNMLGIDMDEQTSIEEQHDALKELINVICGNLLPAIAGKQIIFNVETPRIISASSASRFEGDPEAIAKLSIEDNGHCDILFYVTGEIPDIPAPDMGEEE